MEKEKIVFRDIIGKELKIGNFVSFPRSNSLCIGVIKKFNSKTVSIKQLRPEVKSDKILYQYPNNLSLLDGPELVIFFLKET